LTQAIGSDKPSSTLVVRGFGPLVNEDQISELFRQYALVKSVFLLRDRVNGSSRGIAFVDFPTIENAVFALSASAGIQLERTVLKVAFAKESFVQAQLAAAQVRRI
jgi:RNA recognition motif-containing protein